MVKEDFAPLFSVIVPITDHNVHLLSFTLDSIAEQSFNSYEVIVIDGQTKEHSLDVFDAYRSHIKRIYTALDRNLSAMLNKGVDLAQGQYLHFLQPGEFYTPALTPTNLGSYLKGTGTHQRSPEHYQQLGARRRRTRRTDDDDGQ